MLEYLVYLLPMHCSHAEISHTENSHSIHAAISFYIVPMLKIQNSTHAVLLELTFKISSMQSMSYTQGKRNLHVLCPEEEVGITLRWAYFMRM